MSSLKNVITYTRLQAKVALNLRKQFILKGPEGLQFQAFWAFLIIH